MDDLIKARELPAILGVPYLKVHKWCSSGMIPTFRPPTPSGRGGMMFIQYADLKQFLVKHKFPKKVIAKVDRKYGRK